MRVCGTKESRSHQEENKEMATEKPGVHAHDEDVLAPGIKAKPDYKERRRYRASR